MVRCIFTAMGSKNKLLKEIYEYIPNDTKYYVEPFIGSGVVMFNLPKRYNKIVINDLNSDLINNFKILKNNILDETKIPYIKFKSVSKRAKCNIIKEDREKINKWYDKLKEKTNKTIEEVFFISDLRRRGRFMNKTVGILYRVPFSVYKNRNFIKYHNLLKDVDIFNTDYKNIINQYKDNKDAFIFLDPPYENTRKGYYDNVNMDFEELRDLLKTFKCKFLLTINDSEYIRDLFKDFNIKSVDVKTGFGNIKGYGKIRKELFISN